MVFGFRALTLSFIASTGLLSACATPSETTITRNSQVDDALANPDNECEYDAISNVVARQVQLRDGGGETLLQLRDTCPDLEVAFYFENGRREVRVPFSDGNFSNPSLGAIDSDSEQYSSQFASLSDDVRPGGRDSTGSGTSSGGDSLGGGDSSGGAGSSGGSDSSGGDSTGVGDSSGGDSSGVGDSSSGDSSGGSGSSSGGDGSESETRGGGSKANNGHGNGSEGSSPGRGSRSNDDE